MTVVYPLLLSGLALLAIPVARPQAFTAWFHLRTQRSIAAVLIVDTSASMEYRVGGRSRLDEAKRLGIELLAKLPRGSRVAVLDSAESGGGWLPSVASARDRIERLEVRPANQPVT